MRRKREARLNDYYQEQKGIIFPINRRELYLAGLFLYWGKGAKTHETQLSISNTDPSIINFFIFWLNKILGVAKNNMKINLQLYSDMNIKKEMAFWSATLKISLSQFNKPYVKIASSERINHRGGFGHGTCNVIIGDARLTEKILMAIKAISDKHSNMGV